MLAASVTAAVRGRHARARAEQTMRDLDDARTQLRRDAQLQREIRDLAAAAASAETGERALAELAATRLRSLIGATTASIRRADPDGLTILGYSGPAPTPTRIGWMERSSSTQAVQTSKLARMEDDGPPDAPAPAFAAAQRLTCGISAPIHLDGRTWGSLTVTTNRPGGFDAADEQLLDRFASLVAAPLATAHAHEQLRFRARLDEALRVVATASASGTIDLRALAGLAAARVADLLESNAVALVRRDHDQLVVLGSVGAGALPAGTIISEDSTVAQATRADAAVVERLDDLHADLADDIGAHAGVAVPVHLGGAVWGGFSALLPTTIAPTQAVLLMERFAAIISAALANAQAESRLRDENRLERMMQRITAASATGRLTDRSLGQLVADGVSELLDAPISAVVRRDESWLTTLGRRGRGVPDRVPIGGRSVAARVISTASVVREDDGAGLGGSIVAPVPYEPVGTVIGVPVTSHGQVWGCLIAASEPGHRFDRNREHWLLRFARLISATLANTEAQGLLREQAAVMASLHDGLVVLDDEGEITSVNEPLCAMTGFSAEELVGRRAPYPFASCDDVDVLSDTEGANAVERVLRRRDGSLVRVAASVSTFAKGDGTSVGRAAVLKDVSDSIMQARLERAMRTIASASADGHLDERGLADLAAEQIADLLDAPLGAVLRFEDSERYTVLGHAGDFPFPPALLSADGDTAPVIVARTGQPARIDDYGTVGGRFGALAVGHGVIGGVAVPVRLDGALWGCIWSLTRRVGGFPHGIELQLERLAEVMSVALANVRSVRRLKQEARLEHALREIASASASGQCDADELFALVASRVAEVLDASIGAVVRVDGVTATVVGRHGADGLPSEFLIENSIVGTGAPATNRAVRIEDCAEMLPGSTGEAALALTGCRTAVLVPVRLADRPWGYIGVAREEPYSFAPNASALLERFAALVALALAQASTLAELQRRATTDGLTGLLNHRAFQERLLTEFSRATRHGRPLSLLMFDLDGFKLVNDLHGHEAGNQVLQTIGRCLQEHGRSGDVAARIGGDEFAVIAPETDGAEAMELARRLRTAATATVGELGMPLTLSVGVTDIRDAATMHDLFHLADSALYYAKHHGRDQVVRNTHDERDEETTARASERRRALSGLSALVRAVDARDPSTLRHSERVAEVSVQLAVRLGWSAQRCARLREAALLHDVGKIGVPDAILAKVDRLTGEEHEQLRLHADLGCRITNGILDDEQVAWIRHHHERPDGRGYPDHIGAGDIPDGALLLGLADAYDAMTSGRPYQRAMTTTETIAEMRSLAGEQFDPNFLRVLAEWAFSTVGLLVVPGSLEDGIEDPCDEPAAALSG